MVAPPPAPRRSRAIIPQHLVFHSPLGIPARAFSASSFSRPGYSAKLSGPQSGPGIRDHVWDYLGVFARPRRQYPGCDQHIECLVRAINGHMGSVGRRFKQTGSSTTSRERHWPDRAGLSTAFVRPLDCAPTGITGLGDQPTLGRP